MENTTKFLEEFAKERPVGTHNNNTMVDIVETHLNEMGYSTESLLFRCMTWKWDSSVLTIGGQTFHVEPSPFSEPFHGKCHIIIVKTLDELRYIDCDDSILILSGEITQCPLSPKNYPFYYPDDHKEIIDLIEQKNPLAIIAVTGITNLNGKNPFPFFDDGNFLIPSANIDPHTYSGIEPLLSDETATAELIINSHKELGYGRQIIGSQKVANAKGKIVLAAHMDTKYETPGALDNATGVAVLLEVARSIDIIDYDVDIVPFNTEEYYGANGELEYLQRIDDENIYLMINIDSPCHKGSQIAVSFYNFSDKMQAISDRIINFSSDIVKGEAWYAGDHTPFVFRGIPCMAITSSDFFDGALEHTHTPEDTLTTVDEKLIKTSAKYLADAIFALL